MSFYLYDKPLQFHLRYTICWVLKTCNLYSSGCFFVVEVAWTQLTGDYLAFSGTIKPARWYRHFRQAFFSSTVVAVEFSWNQQGKAHFFYETLSASVFLHSAAMFITSFWCRATPHRSPRRGWIPYSRLPHKPFFSHREYYSYYIIHCSYYGY